MLPRILEPEVMDTLEEALAYDAMDHTEVNRRFVDDLLQFAGQCEVVPSGDWLDLGTGPADIPLELCRRCDAVRVMAVDLSTHMLDVARLKIEIAGLTDRVHLDCIDAKQLPYPDGAFAGVMSNSIVHHVPQPLAVLRQAWRVTRPGGLIFFRDLLRPTSDNDLRRLVDLYAADCTEQQRRMFADSLHAALSLDEMRALVADLGVAADSVQPTSDRHWTWAARKPV
jgi:ubiquinone/menaquinone biosynthesis C-methylase UbiE